MSVVRAGEDVPPPGFASSIARGYIAFVEAPRLLRIGLGLLVVLVALAVLAPLVTSGEPNALHFDAQLAPPSWAHPLGTDQLGRDEWTRLVYAARTDLKIGILAAVFPFLLGSLIGLIGGYVGGVLDAAISRVIDMVIAFPFYVLLIALVFVLGPGERSILIAFTVVSWVTYARIVRAQVLSLREQDFIVAARLGGLSHRTVMIRHILPNVISHPVVYGMSDIVLDILAIVTLGYLGLGVSPPTAEWGSMIAEAQPQMTSNWWLIVAPGLAVVVTGLGLSMVGDGLAKRWRVS
jgi:peptide/nickel transport system permease protein